ncbi:hypothetical protein CC80DRAFT_472817 [Byssothecium circinans]|uniref:Uncharacterized protein n=1 Tax=Byssothecium circinans TaxID=147558 RepID=A0A6A5TUN9_9PLEO|nr:hypothetical protein CC80DRAFT_472817 [Byssothecium circinans]
MSDVDGDSTMHSSPELPIQDEEMFPEDPSTPKNAATHALDPVSELSPPLSQGASQNKITDPVINANGKRILTASGAGEALPTNVVQTDPATGYQWTKQEDRPGFEWMNARAREEADRAWESIVDKASQIKTKYGDPLKPEVPMRLGR